MTDPAKEIHQWLASVVIGLDLCPFAALPLRLGRVRIATSEADDDESLLLDLHGELVRLDSCNADTIETTLLVVTRSLTDFGAYNQFLDLAEALVVACGYEGIFQIASFHPRYVFEGSAPGDRANLTNCSPWPVLHILREESVTAALDKHAQPDDIYTANIRTLRSLPKSEIRALFSWLDCD